MENDPNKKESKGKRILKKALRRISKSSNNSQTSTDNISVTRSKSFENKRLSVEINESTPKADISCKAESISSSARSKLDNKLKPSIKQSLKLEPSCRDTKLEKVVEIQEERNEIIELKSNDDRSRDSPHTTNDVTGTEIGSAKKTLKRKFEEESLAGTSGASTGASDTDADDREGRDKKKKNRCAVCRKKVGLTGFECRCGGLFCAVHRYSDKHECSFDYRELGAQEIRRNNPVVVSQKIHKI
ncbi:unnamed protein product [Leptidea sinapis]|uniref:AN1-type domain-containing protein n=2 Tax=Leptidea sinapis TaxID=189913 RepID=A0A5E4QB67_9NEOP|nr:unnamed protein product [Leptidea sinapis]